MNLVFEKNNQAKSKLHWSASEVAWLKSKYNEGLGVDQIAKEMYRSVSAVKAKIWRMQTGYSRKKM